MAYFRKYLKRVVEHLHRTGKHYPGDMPNRGARLKRLYGVFLVVVSLPISGLSFAVTPSTALPSRPNILLIVADDLGYSDLGSFGSEINTPVLDELAYAGTRYTNFHTAPSCSPTRAMLMTGLDHHRVGLGNMAVWLAPNQRGKPGYEGHLNNAVTTLPQQLREMGYHTYMAGKWHLGSTPENWPAARGFERDLSLIGGAGSHFADMLNIVPRHPLVTMTYNGQQITELPEEYFSTKNFTDFLIEEIGNGSADNKPFFAYLSLQVPHVPLQLPDDWIDRNRGLYNVGYDTLREARLQRQKLLGITGAETVNAVGEVGVPPWDSLSDKEKRNSARKMEIYAGIVENMDFHIGRLLQFLETSGKRANTLIIFMSDNGPAAENTRQFVSEVMGERAGSWFDNTFDNRYENYGQKGSWIGYGPAWAQLSAVPFRLFKATVAEGGVRVPLIIVAPDSSTGGKLVHSLTSVPKLTDIMLTMAKERLTRIPKNRPQHLLGMELFGQRALIRGRWKILKLPVNNAANTWALYDMDSDPTEQINLADTYPDIVKDMSSQWLEYARINGVILPSGRQQPRPWEVTP